MMNQQNNRRPINGLQDFIISAHLSHRFAKQMEHAVSHQQTDWQLFEPSKFIYSFFTFNTLYEIDWDETFKRRRIRDTRNLYTQDKIKKYVKFIYRDKKQSLRANFGSNLSNEFLINIKIDANINRVDKSLVPEKTVLENFKEAVIKFCDSTTDFDETDHYKILFFIYQIRNNIFHGTKKIRTMMERGQRERLLIYSNFIQATNEMFFGSISSQNNLNLATDFEVFENVRQSKHSYI